jgi:heme/copper-type cytochrome/quinol oxidase subunit 4
MNPLRKEGLQMVAFGIIAPILLLLIFLLLGENGDGGIAFFFLAIACALFVIIGIVRVIRSFFEK